MSEISIDDRLARKINDLAKLFYSDPENVRKFEEWKKTYNGGKNESGKKEEKERIV